jgi:hypothetical protein
MSDTASSKEVEEDSVAEEALKGNRKMIGEDEEEAVWMAD